MLNPHLTNNAESILRKVYADFVKDFSFQLKIAFEIEFYLIGSKGKYHEKFFDEFNSELKKRGFLTTEISKEISEEQYEISMQPLSDPILAFKTLNKLKSLLQRIGSRYNYMASFEAKPFPNRSGSGLHVHCSIHDSNGNNLYSKKLNSDEESDILLNSIGGLCEIMGESMIFFSPTKKSFNRFKRNYENEYFPFDFSPTNISWGGNNRTVAIRIPTSTTIPQSRHIEHRVPCADANPALVLIAIIAGINYGLKNNIQPKTKKYYGNAFEASDTLEWLPKNITEAKAKYYNGIILNKLTSKTNYV
jgi:glutamine synthetase